MLKIIYSVISNPSIKGFTLIELMVSISVTSILAVIAVPNFSNFIVKIRVNNEISQLHRMLLITRNTAINSGHKVIICPLDNNSQCTTQWQNKLSVFVDVNNNKLFDVNEKVIKVRPKITSGDALIYGKKRNKITFKPTGQLSGLANGTFRYCPQSHKKYSRGIVVARSGRVYQSSDIDNDGIDENRGNKEINCD
ncbi:MAG: type IV fimbrial biogenesis protein FimT [Psychromonas sp.]|jgi:type IV fimbrial biogenesis protein FimT|uniref:GspH/FimT family pseudopilin n=1 Tax=Psychromonas sp. TaxID=1884585 RepID=UPI0039E27A3B|tara:strand:+ start:7933 stop:8517 length:585 start_codon:yes stop_codon:yes gene_type:complete